MITVVCVLVKGHVGYTPEYVQRLYSMVRRYMPAGWLKRFVCLTDQSIVLQGVETWPVQTPDGYYPWWAKIELFNPKLFQPKELVLYFDLDVLIIRPLGWVSEYPNFTLIPHAGKFKGCGSLRVVPRYNSSCMIWKAEQGYHLYNAWSRDVTSRLWGDQD